MTPEQLVAQVRDLVSLPEVAMRVNSMIDDPNCSAPKIGRVIDQDAGLTARLLRMANSAFYGLAAQVETTARAISVIGSDRLRELVLATSAISTFNRIPNDLVSMEDFWCHNIYCALAARYLAQLSHRVPPESVFVAGLLHDVGRLVIFTRLPDQARDALWRSIDGPGEVELQVAEREVLGFDHAEVGGALARSWKLPRSLGDPIEFHHQPDAAAEYPVETAIVHIANSVAFMAEVDDPGPQSAPRIEPAALALVGLDREVIEPAMCEAQAGFSEVRDSLFEKAAAEVPAVAAGADGADGVRAGGVRALVVAFGGKANATIMDRNP